MTSASSSYRPTVLPSSTSTFTTLASSNSTTVFVAPVLASTAFRSFRRPATTWAAVQTKLCFSRLKMTPLPSENPALIVTEMFWRWGTISGSAAVAGLAKIRASVTAWSVFTIFLVLRHDCLDDVLPTCQLLTVQTPDNTA